jgi:hypothetical protein
MVAPPAAAPRKGAHDRSKLNHDCRRVAPSDHPWPDPSIPNVQNRGSGAVRRRSRQFVMLWLFGESDRLDPVPGEIPG